MICEWRFRHDDQPCVNAPTERVQIGVYAGYWRLCSFHAEAMMAEGAVQGLKVFREPLKE